MPLTFDKLRERNNTDIKGREVALLLAGEELDADPDVIARKKIRGRVYYSRKRIQNLIDQRIQIERLASTRDQREEYGIEKWHEQFIRLSDIREHPNSNLEGEELRQYIWSKVKNSRFKRFQEAFCHPHNFIVPLFTLDQNGYVSFGASSDFNRMSLQPCLVSPDRIPDKLAEDLKLVDFSEDNKGKLHRLTLKRDAIPQLKKIWESTVALQHGHHRILMVHPAGAAQNKRYADVNGPDPTIAGTLLYTRAENGSEPRQLVVQHFDSVYAMQRKTFHEADAHFREINLLAEMKEELTILNQTLNKEWRKDTPEERKNALRQQAGTLLSRASNLLRMCLNKYKTEAHDFIAASVNLTDQNGKVNVSSCMSKMVAAITRLEQRFDDIYPKEGYNRQDQTVLQRSIRQHETGMKSFRHIVETDALRVHPQHLDRIRLEPFRTYAELMRRGCHDLSAAHSTHDQDAAMDALIRMHVIGKFQAVRTCFEHIKQYVIDAESVPVSRIRSLVGTLHTLFRKRQIFPEREVDGFQEHFETMRAELAVIEDQLKIYAGQDLEINERSEMYKRLKQYLERFDLEAMAQSLG